MLRVDAPIATFLLKYTFMLASMQANVAGPTNCTDFVKFPMHTPLNLMQLSTKQTKQKTPQATKKTFFVANWKKIFALLVLIRQIRSNLEHVSSQH